MQSLVPAAQKMFAFVSLGIQDAPRVQRRFLFELVKFADDLGVNRLRIADTIGILNPLQTFGLIAAVKSKVPEVSLDFHGHNDLGMATANSIAAIEAGAKSVNVTVGGLGERAGNAPLEEVAMALMTTPDKLTSIDLRSLTRLCQRVSAMSRRPIPIAKPITGEAVFVHESGIHCQAQLYNFLSYQPFASETVGRQSPEFVLGKHSGSASIQYIMAKHGVPISKEEATELLGKLRRAASSKKGSVSVEELKAIYYGMGGTMS
jgi:homocitrate synthase NifV